MALVRTNVSEQCITSITVTERISKPADSTLMLEAIFS
jgi:hypothetical protein